MDPKQSKIKLGYIYTMYYCLKLIQPKRPPIPPLISHSNERGILVGAYVEKARLANVSKASESSWEELEKL